MTRYDLQQMSIDELVELAKKNPAKIKKHLVEYMVKTLDVGEEKALFEALCGNYGLKPSDWGKPFKQGRTTLKITGFRPNKPKNKFGLTDQNGKPFHCGESFIRSYLGKPRSFKPNF